jgi:signal transduction histidine kinase/ActR/RegA family two-component response regulator
MSELAKIREQLSNAFDDTNARDRRRLPFQGREAGFDAQETSALNFAGRLAAPALWISGGGLLTVAVLATAGADASPYLALPFLAAMTGAVIWPRIANKFNKGSGQQAQAHRESPDRSAHNAGLTTDIHDAMGDIVVTRDMDRRILDANETFREVTGFGMPEGRTCEEIGLAFRPGGKAHCYDVEIPTPYGQRIFTWHDVVARDLTSSRLVIRSIARDVTDERLALVTREEARVRAENANAAKGRLLATVSHEIRLPLSGILGMNHLLSQTRLNDEQRNYLDAMRQSGQSLVQLVEDLLDFSTMEAGRFKLNPRAENLRQLIESIVEMLAHRAHEKGIEIASMVDPNVPDYLDFDPARLRQVLFNLIGNAVKFTAAGGVLVRASMDGQELVMTVEDTGPGMDETEQARIFGEFEQAGSALQRSGGTGLGLAISARIVREFGGTLSVTSQKGKGSTFSLKFRAGFDAAQQLSSERRDALEESFVLLLAPDGVAAMATYDSIVSLGGMCLHVSDTTELSAIAGPDGHGFDAVTDVIVDHRVAALFADHLANWTETTGKAVRRILLVNPEERASQPQEAFDAWLIRPLREKSLTDVLCGRMRGMEKRDAINDNHPGFGFSASFDKPSGGLDILVAEDDPVNARLIRAVLEKSGHSVRLVEDFPALVSVMEGELTELPDLVISDLNMPGGEGLDVLSGICGKTSRSRHVPVIVLSGDATEVTRKNVMELGVRSILTKPVDPKRLIEEIYRLLPQKQQSAP